MARKGTRKKKRFSATSLPVLSPKTLQKGKSKRKKKASRTRNASAFKKLSRSWNFSHYIAIMLIGTSIAAIIFLLTDVTFQATTPQIRGNSYLSSEQILQQAHLDGQNIYLIDPADVSRRLDTFLPQIKRARVRLGLPNQIIIQIDERKPVLAYTDGSQSLWADAEGRLFPITIEESNALPTLIDEDGSASIDGKHLTPGIWQAVQEISANIPEIKKFYYRDVYGLFFISPEGWRVYLGNGNDMESKLAMWQAIRQQLLQENREIKSVDLRYDRVYIQ